MIFKMAVRNALRYRKRSLAVFISVSVSITIFVLALSLIAGMQESFKTTVFKNIGHVVLFAKGYFDRSEMLPLDRMIQSPDSIIDIVKNNKYVVDAYKEIKFSAVLINGEKSVDVIVRAIGTDDTLRYPRYRKGIVDGRFISERNEIIIGKPLLKLMELTRSQTAVLLSYNTNGGMNAVEAQIAGSFETDSREENQNMVFVNQETACELLQHKNIASDIHVILHDENMAEEFVKETEITNATFRQYGIEIFPWKTVYKEIGTGLAFINFLLVLLLLIVFLIITVSIINTQLMTVFERIRYIGTLRSIGFGKEQVLFLIMCETAIISLLATFLGVIIGSIIVSYFNHAGIQLGENYGPLARMIYPQFSINALLLTFVGGLCISLAGSLYPALIAAKMNPLKALNHN